MKTDDKKSLECCRCCRGMGFLFVVFAAVPCWMCGGTGTIENTCEGKAEDFLCCDKCHKASPILVPQWIMPDSGWVGAAHYCEACHKESGGWVRAAKETIVPSQDKAKDENCSECGGLGLFMKSVPGLVPLPYMITCRDCDGTGKKQSATAPTQSQEKVQQHFTWSRKTINAAQNQETTMDTASAFEKLFAEARDLDAKHEVILDALVAFPPSRMRSAEYLALRKQERDVRKQCVQNASRLAMLELNLEEEVKNITSQGVQE